uniref:Uncharacterized protein n=1 Tax=Lactuca sativa TaxID=4236 RepID=A0A9R1V8B6_LACSA|nr:hypothetical protein LSAT_V11C600331280 [Lactuca sativa]
MVPDVPYHKHLPPKRRRLPSRTPMKKNMDAIERGMSRPSRKTVTRKRALIRCGICKELGHNKKKCPSKPTKQYISSSRGGGACPSSSRPPPPPTTQPPPPLPPPPPAIPVPRRRAPVSRSGRRKYFERIIK